MFGNFPSLFMGLVADDGGLGALRRRIRFVDGAGTSRRRWARSHALRQLHRRDDRAMVVPEVPLLSPATPPECTASARWHA